MSQCVKESTSGFVNYTPVGAILFLVLLATMLSGCGSKRTHGLISEPGAYPRAAGDIELIVSRSSDGIVTYQIINSDTGEELASNGGFSASHRWFFFWDGDDLWSYNSDMGPLAVWIEDPASGWAMEEVEQDSVRLTHMPIEVYDGLPNSMKGVLGIENGLPQKP